MIMMIANKVGQLELARIVFIPRVMSNRDGYLRLSIMLAWVQRQHEDYIDIDKIFAISRKMKSS